MTRAPEYESWYDVLVRRAREGGTWLIRPIDPTRSADHRAISYEELLDGVKRIARLFDESGVRSGERVLLLADNTIESAIFALGALANEVVVVPIPPPGYWQRAGAWEATLARSCSECEGHVLLVSDRAAIAGRILPVALNVIEFARVSELSPQAISPQATGDRPAVIQYTSGTTGTSRGVQLTFGNLHHCVWNIGHALDLTPGDTGVSWLPIFHDMGLIGALLTATFWGMRLVFMEPRSFALRPESWLWAISRFRATCSVGPNSAYHVCAKRVPDKRIEGLDLGSWRVSLNGAELIHPETIEAFTTRFSRYGYRASAMYPVYGLAEHTVAASMPSRGEPPKLDWIDREKLEAEDVASPSGRSASFGRGVVCLGKPLVGHEIRICDPDRHAVLAERVVGEIQLRGPCTMQGYLGHGTADELTLDGWLRTGDRGYLAAGELYVVGRYKQLIKRGGRALDAAFIENCIRSLPGVRGGVVAVFGVADAALGTERIVVMTEAAQCVDTKRLAAEIVGVFTGAMLPAPDHIAFVKPATLPRTTSGKVRQDASRKIFLRSGGAPSASER